MRWGAPSDQISEMVRPVRSARAFLLTTHLLLVFDRFSAVPLFLGTAIALPALAWWFAGKLRQRTKSE